MRPWRMISRLAKMFSATERLPNRFSSWNTMPMPCAIASPVLAEDDRLAVEQDAPGGRPFDAGDHLHQRRLAGAVLADQHVDRAAPHLEIGLLDRDGAGIDLRSRLRGAGRRPGRSLGGVAHGLGPIVISTGVTSGVSAVETNG